MPIARLELLPEKPAVFKGRLDSVCVVTYNEKNLCAAANRMLSMCVQLPPIVFMFITLICSKDEMPLRISTVVSLILWNVFVFIFLNFSFLIRRGCRFDTIQSKNETTLVNTISKFLTFKFRPANSHRPIHREPSPFGNAANLHRFAKHLGRRD